MFKKTIENTSPKRQRVNESQSVHSLAFRACKGAEQDDVQRGCLLIYVISLQELSPVISKERQEPDANACRLTDS